VSVMPVSIAEEQFYRSLNTPADLVAADYLSAESAGEAKHSTAATGWERTAQD
jgi:hypothetical protein